MKCFLISLLSVLTGCAHHQIKPSPEYSAPTAARVTAPVAAIKTATDRANSDLMELEKHIDPSGSKVLASLKENILDVSQSCLSVQTGLSSYIGEVKTQTKALNDAIIEKNLALVERDAWQSKQEKALRKLWFWRVCALIEIGSIAFYVGIRMGWKFMV